MSTPLSHVGPSDLLTRLLSAASERGRVLAENLANANTPGYQRRELHFEDLLRRAVDAGDELSRVAPRVELDAISPARADGNNVTLEQELGALRENRLVYEAYAAILATRTELVRASIEQGR
jgi:flagellar basal-body rod protein FlgB